MNDDSDDRDGASSPKGSHRGRGHKENPNDPSETLGPEDVLGTIIGRLGRLLGQAQDVFEEATNSNGNKRDRKDDRLRTSSKMTIRTVGGENVSLSSIMSELNLEPENTTEHPELREFKPEFVVDTPELLVAVSDVPGSTLENVDVTIDGDVMVIRSITPTVEYWAEVLMHRNVDLAKREVLVLNGILSIIWKFPVDTK
ncbi:hypothetical protein GCM10011363_44890 [Marivita lacus]|uniref:Uncharacterized protein n=1 Tax=Marivita lacus TaxID=1323742 RepID=A0ABQ1LG91_9RHOB|nr:hypothetical protein [Marivita lacus]GGC23442.1 hypothetical protein GCM10011363_44890 [Marivita lacus]